MEAISEVNLHITKSVEIGTASKMFRALAEARRLKSELWTKIVWRVMPETQAMLYEYSGLTILTASLGDMLQPGINQLTIRPETQLESLEEANKKVIAMLALTDVLGKLGGPGQAEQTRSNGNRRDGRHEGHERQSRRKAKASRRRGENHHEPTP